MWPWMRRWRDWAIHDAWPNHRRGAQALYFGYEKAGLVVHEQPIPWNAESVLVEALVHLPHTNLRRKSDFQLRLDGSDPHPAEAIRRQEGDQRHRVTFRLPPPQSYASAEILWRDHVLGQLTLPVIGRDEFIQNLHVQMPTLSVRLAHETVACRTFVATQCQGLLVSAVLTSPTSLVPLLDLDLKVEFAAEHKGATYVTPARLSSSQLEGRQALITVVPRRFSRRMGTWNVTWFLGDHVLASQRIRAISQRAFRDSLQLTDTRFVIQHEKTGVSVARQVPPTKGQARIGPCFLVSSGEPGMAGVCKFLIRAQGSDAREAPTEMEQEVLITDGPTPVAPGTLDWSALEHISGFELLVKRRSLGVLTLAPAPTAAFTAEGGFRQVQDYSWNAGAEEELTERLNRLIDGPDVRR